MISISICISICCTLYHIWIYSYYTICTILYIYIRLYILDYIYSAQLKTCRRLGDWITRADISNDLWRQLHTKICYRVFDAWPAGRANAFTTDSLFGSTCTWRKLVCNTKYGPKNGVNFRTYNLFPSLLRAGFGGRWLVCETGLATSQLSFFFPFCPIMWDSIWSAWPQLQRFSVCQTGFTTKGSSCWKFPCAIIIIYDQHSYCDCRHTHTVYTFINLHILYYVYLFHTPLSLAFHGE